MGVLTDEERSDFTAAASAFLAARERLELMKEQAADQLGGRPGRVPMPDQTVNPIMQPGHRLREVLTAIQLNHPGLPGIRFRGHIFTLMMFKGQVMGVHILQESEIENL